MRRLIVHDREIHLYVDDPPQVGDTIEVIRGSGPREGDRMGVATVTAIEDGAPVLRIHFDEGKPAA
jgi:hypothetical protein